MEVVDVASGTEGLTLKQEASGARLGVNGAAFSPDGTRLATVDKYEVVTLWNTANGEAVFTMKRDNRGLKWFSTVAFSPDGTRLAVAYVDSTVSVWNALTGEEALRLEGHFHTISSVAFSPDGKQLATGGSALNKDLMPGDIPRDAFVRLWDAESGVEIVRLKGFSQIIDDSLAFSPDGRRLLATENDTGQIKVWDVTPGPTDEVPPKD